MREADLAGVREAALSFLTKMADWEGRCHPAFSAGRLDREEALRELRAIYAGHLTSAAAGRRQARYRLEAFGDPPYFAPTILGIEAEREAEGDGYWVEIPEGMFGKLRLLFVNEDGAWKIARKEVEWDDGSWRAERDI